MLTVNTTSGAGGTPVTLTLTNGFGGQQDWMTLAASGSAETSYVQWTYVGTGVTTRTWTVPLPSTPGTYQFRLYLNGGTVRAATSPDVTVTASPPTVTQLLPASAVAGSAPVTLIVNGANFVPASVVRWNGADRPTTFVSAAQVRATIAASDLAAAGTACSRLNQPRR